MKSLILLISFVSLLSFALLYEEEVKLEISINDVPQQTKTHTSPFEHENFKIEPLYDYKIKALVLSKKKYNNNKKESDLSRFDLALGWKEMSKKENVDRISISQSNRWYYWNVNDFFISRKQIEHNSSNHHMIHGSKEVLDTLKKVEKDHVVEISGYLVKVTDNTNWLWTSSTTRKDTGANACEVFYVKNIKILN